MSSTILLGIDPGLSITGYSLVKKEFQKTYLIDCGFLKLPPTKSISERIGIFHTFFSQKITQHSVREVALETPFLGKNAQNFLKLGYLRGIIYLLADSYHLTIHEFSPRQVKLSITGYGGADKDQVCRVLMRLFPGMQQPSKLDASDSLAVALCGLWHIPEKIL